MQPIINLPFDLSAYSYNLFFVLGIYIGIIIFYLEVKRKKWDIENLMFAMSGCFIGSMIGALLFNTILFGTDDTLKKIFEFNVLGMSVLGGILGGFIGVEIFKMIIVITIYMLEKLPYPIDRFSFPDHYNFTAKDFLNAGIDQKRPLIMTEKDAIKCESFANNNYWCIQV